MKFFLQYFPAGHETNMAYRKLENFRVGKIRLVTLRTIHSNFHTFRQEFERANKNAFFNHCNSEDGKCELHVHSFTILASVWLQLCQLTPWWHSAEVHASTKNSAQCYRTDSEEVGHGHVTYVGKRIHAVSLWRFLYWKNDQNFLSTFFNYPKGIDIIQKR